MGYSVAPPKRGNKVIGVLVVEDSAVLREFLVHILSADPEICVVGTPSDGDEAVGAAERLKPDIITMDIHMPRVDGLEATRHIMQTRPTPIILVTGSSNAKELTTAIKAVDVGALSVIQRPPGVGRPGHAEAAAELITSIKLMSEVRVVRAAQGESRSVGYERVQPARVPVRPRGFRSTGTEDQESLMVARE